jgi:hypothetical protein
MDNAERIAREQVRNYRTAKQLELRERAELHVRQAESWLNRDENCAPARAQAHAAVAEAITSLAMLYKYTPTTTDELA